MAMRMGGEAPNLGLVLTKGSLSGYSVERDLTKMSNDRGDFILHPTPFSLAPGESYSVEWTLFPFSSKEDFFKQANKHCGHFVRIEADRYVIFKGESINVVITPEFVYNRDSVRIFENNVQIHDDEIHIMSYDMDAPNNGESIGEVLYIHKDYRNLPYIGCVELEEE